MTRQASKELCDQHLPELVGDSGVYGAVYYGFTFHQEELCHTSISRSWRSSRSPKS